MVVWLSGSIPCMRTTTASAFLSPSEDTGWLWYILWMLRAEISTFTVFQVLNQTYPEFDQMGDVLLTVYKQLGDLHCWFTVLCILFGLDNSWWFHFWSLIIGLHNSIALLCVFNRFWTAVEFFGTEAWAISGCDYTRSTCLQNIFIVGFVLCRETVVNNGKINKRHTYAFSTDFIRTCVL